MEPSYNGKVSIHCASVIGRFHLICMRRVLALPVFEFRILWVDVRSVVSVVTLRSGVHFKKTLKYELFT